MASLFRDMKPQGGQKMRPFDLSRRDVFSVKSGVLNVNFVQDVIPESKYEVNHAQITRVDPVQTAPFARMSENYEYYFVPYSQLWHDFEKMYYERGDNQRNALNHEVDSNAATSDQVPVFDYYSVVSKLASWFLYSRIWLKMYEQDSRAALMDLHTMAQGFDVENPENSRLPFDVHGECCIDEMLKLFDMLGFGNLFPIFNSVFQSVFSFSVPVPDLKKSYTDFFYQYVHDDNTLLYRDYNLFLAFQVADILGVPYDLNGDVLTGYYAGIMSYDDLFNYSSSSQQSAHFSIVNIFKINSDGLPGWLDPDHYDDFWEDLIAPVFDIFFLSDGFLNFYLRWEGNLLGSQYRPSILRLAAYNKVWADIYRNSQYDNANYAPWFNFDYMAYAGVNNVVPTNRVLGMLIPKFRQYKKDMFTGTFPNAQFGSVAISSLKNPTRIETNIPKPDGSAWLAPQVASGDGVRGRLTYGAEDGRTGHVTLDNNWIVDTGVSALAIRQALSLQRYKERILRAGNRLTALQNAVFGDRSRFIEDSYVKFIGAESNGIDFNSVAATSDAGSSEVGQLSANGVGTHMGKALEFHSHDFGIIIGIYYILPESEYEAYMFDPMVTKSESNDFYKPDFMNLGLSPVFNYFFNVLGYVYNPAPSQWDMTQWRVPESVLGYLANYFEYKTAIDKVHGNFYASLPFFNPTQYDKNLPNIPAVTAFMRGQNAHYVTPRSAASFRDTLQLGNLYVNPHDIDSIFYANSDFTLNTDQFKCNCNHEVKALLPMSVVGLPDV